jgi:hypothetical protein
MNLAYLFSSGFKKLHDRNFLTDLFYVFCLSVLVLLGSWLRLYKLETHFVWTGDQARDVLIAKRIVTSDEFIWVAPNSSDNSGLLQNSPLYFYFIALFWLILPSPYGVSLCFAFLGILTIVVAYLVGKETWSREAGLLCAAFVSLHDFFVAQSWIWQPHLISFFIALSLLFLFRGLRGNKLYLFLSTVIIFFAVNIHYSALPLLPVIIAICFLKIIYDFWKSKFSFQSFYFCLAYMGLVFFGIEAWIGLAFKKSPSNIFLFASRLFGTHHNLFDLVKNLLSMIDVVILRLLVDFNFEYKPLFYIAIVVGLFSLILYLHYHKKNSLQLICLLILNLSLIPVSLYSIQANYYFFTPYYFIIILSVSILLSSFFSRVWFLKLLLIFPVLSYLLMSSYKHEIEYMTADAFHIFENATLDIYSDFVKTNMKSTFDNVVYVYTNDETSYPPWDTTPIWFSLEEISHQEVAQVVPSSTSLNNFLPPVKTSKVAYVVCADVIGIGTQVLDRCQDKIKDYLKYRADLSDQLTFSVISNKYPLYIIYKINSSKALPAL